MTVKQVLKYFGGQSATARAVGVTHQAVAQWAEKNQVPEGRQWQIQTLTGGALTVSKKLIA